MFHHRKSKLEIFGEYVNAVVLFLIAASMLFPFIYIFAISFASLEEFLTKDLLLWPEKWQWSAYEYIFESGQFVKALGVSVYVTVVGTFVNMLMTGQNHSF